MGGVAIGSPVSAANTNQAFIDANGDDQTIGKLGLANTDPVSGVTIDNAQREHNAVSSYTGMPTNSVKTVLPAWVDTSVGAPTDNLENRSEALTVKFNSTTGHKHTGAAGDAPPVESADLASVVLTGKYKAGTNIVGAVGSSTDVTSLLLLAVPSTTSTTKGVVVNNPFNYVFIFNLDGDAIVDGTGNIVYGRLTESAGVWTLSYYSYVLGVETSYSFAVAEDLRWSYQQLYNPIVDAPVYSDLTSVPSDNTTADVVDATETQAGKVLLSNVVAQSVGSTNVKGVATRVSKEDHAHQGVHSIFKFGDTQIYGDVELAAGVNATLVRSGNKFTFDTNGAVGFQEVPAGPVNGVNATFGPLSQLPSSTESVIVFVDGLPVDKSKWSLSGYSIIFGSGFEPVTGQDVYCFYLSAGVPAIPPTPSGTLVTEFRTITAPEAAAKIVVLANTPSSPGIVLVDIIGGTSQEFNVDYTVVADEFRWNGYALDGVLSSGDKIRFHYII